ncbi:DUF3099 domain-containing protein [Antiquaquibacter soli]|uniref:DUF3099 domain-containing protein n=1 Tax=Antiquaquibacter soli TaxID=3064523 RepID=A0ABT9BLP7_9MICO|nr:DUF3099 domain-containing protein [Protaetiibacter sp. WY-16]MDO7881942.1 DUF3099 domain-containing protein [Protaetiibacter sp. WY-16]
MNTPQSITTLGESPEEERNRRMLRYAIAMGIRTVCVILCFFVQGWWLVLPILGAIVLPYVAVVIANASSRPTTGAVESVRFSLPAPDRGDADR